MPNVEGILETIAGVLNRSMGCTSFFVSSFDEAAQLIFCVGGWEDGTRLDVSGFPPIPLEAKGRGTESLVIRSGQPLSVPDYDARVRTAATSYHLDDNHQLREGPSVAEERVRSAIMVPLKIAGAITGVLQAFSERPAAFSTEDLHLLEALSVPVSGALQNASLNRLAQEERNRRARADDERRSLEAVVRHAQKLEALGLLAGGLAHDFNNILMAVTGHIELAEEELDRLPESGPARVQLERALSAVRRGTQLTRGMLAYAGQADVPREAVVLADVVDEVLVLAQASIPKEVSVQHAPRADGGIVMGDPTQITQVVMNLVINAAEAVGSTAGKVRIATSLVTCSHSELAGMRMGQGLAAGDYLCLEVRDTGCGMEAHALARIFDPFFSTKVAGRGLGLSAFLGIVRDHGGAVSVQSSPGEGSTFKVVFPRMAKGEVTVAADAPGEPWKAGGTVLAIDDEPSLREILSRLLARMGSRTVVAADGMQGLQSFSQQQDDIRLVLVDLAMPRMGGEEVVRALRPMRPGLPIILMSGYPVEKVGEFAGVGVDGFLQKPFRAAHLDRAIGDALASAWRRMGGV